MKKNTQIAASLLLSLGLVAGACGSDDADAIADDVAEEVEDVTTLPEVEEVTTLPEVAEDEMAEDEMAEDDVAEDEMAEDEMAEDGDSTEPATVVDIALSDDNFSILVAALTQANLVETLQGPGPFTVFAPTNDAFAQALTDLGITQDELLAREDLADILTYHVIAGSVDAGAAIAADGTEVETVNGDTVEISVVDGKVMVDGATVTTADLMAGNGIVHVIDSVILPG